jgi:hypothetical protein
VNTQDRADRVRVERAKKKCKKHKFLRGTNGGRRNVVNNNTSVVVVNKTKTWVDEGCGKVDSIDKLASGGERSRDSERAMRLALVIRVCAATDL